MPVAVPSVTDAVVTVVTVGGAMPMMAD